MIDGDALAREFEASFGRAPRVHRAPGRVNLIGEHTDYNDGFVLPMALDRSTWVAAAPRDDRKIVVRSREYGETVTIDLGGADTRVGPYQSGGVGTCVGPCRPGVGADPRVRPAWARYVAGVAALLESPGADLLIASDVPIGAGLSSSAALEVACASALADAAGTTIDPTTLARLCQRAEHEYAGIRCGIMDQMIACHGRAGHAMMLDTRSLERTWVPVPATVRVVVCNTMVTHALAAAEYNARRADCEAGVAALSRRAPRIRALRDATIADLDAIRNDVPAQVVRRCRHVIAENDRVPRAAAALASGDYRTVGALMDASHASLRDDYEVSCPELDIMAAIVSSLDGVYGARMTGGGFGGCVVALIEAGAASAQLRETVRERYEANTGLCPDVWVCTAGNGVSAWSPMRV